MGEIFKLYIYNKEWIKTTPDLWWLWAERSVAFRGLPRSLSSADCEGRRGTRLEVLNLRRYARRIQEAMYDTDTTMFTTRYNKYTVDLWWLMHISALCKSACWRMQLNLYAIIRVFICLHTSHICIRMFTHICTATVRICRVLGWEERHGRRKHGRVRPEPCTLVISASIVVAHR